jgi:hypothetical protein
MMLWRPTRRDILASAATAVTGFARPSRTVVVRRDIGSMSASDPELRLFRDAVSILRQRSRRNPLDPAGWLVNASHHSLYCATHDFDNQVHYCWLFFPWHRAYLWGLEKRLQEAVKEPKLALPYWDWTKTPQLPAHYFGEGNPLADFTRLQRQTDVLPADFLDVAPILRAKSFAAFGGWPKQRRSDPQVEGIAEQGAHNNVHNWIGGNMAGFATAGLDPVFSAHHGNLDRLWEAWLAADPGHRNPEDSRWLDHRFTLHDGKGKPEEIAIRDLVKPESLGYRFDRLDFEKTLDSPNAPIPRYRPDPYHQRAPVEFDTSGEKPKAGQIFMIRFERVHLPVMPLCIRVFCGPPDDSDPIYSGTFTLLPVADHESGMLDRTVSMQIELPAALTDRASAGGGLAVTLVPVELRGRVLPTQPIRLGPVRLTAGE